MRDEDAIRTAANHAPIMMWMAGPDGHYRYLSDGWLHFTGRALEQELGNGYAENLYPDDRPTAEQVYHEHFERRSPYEVEYRLRRHDGEYRWILDRAAPYDLPNGDFGGFVGTCVDITERKTERETLRSLAAELERRVEARTAELTAVNKELESFTYSVSHDLRAPLRAISGYASILLDDYGDRLDDEGRRMLRRQVDAAGRMEGLIGDLLHYSRLGRGELERIDFDFSRLAKEVGDEIASRDWGVPVHIEVEPGMRMNGDLRLLRTVIQNLIENGVKYSTPKGEARVTVGREGEAFVVRDQGIGIDMRHADKLFQPFERLHRASEFPGTGIGLANVRKVVERHGGKVWAESAPDEGSAFFFTIPG